MKMNIEKSAFVVKKATLDGNKKVKSEITAFKLVSSKFSWKDRILTIVCMVSGVQFTKRQTRGSGRSFNPKRTVF